MKIHLEEKQKKKNTKFWHKTYLKTFFSKFHETKKKKQI